MALSRNLRYFSPLFVGATRSTPHININEGRFYLFQSPLRRGNAFNNSRQLCMPYLQHISVPSSSGQRVQQHYTVGQPSRQHHFSPLLVRGTASTTLDRRIECM